MYKYELHCHTKGVSPCGHIAPKELVDYYLEKGYTGVNLTNHWSYWAVNENKKGKCSIDELADFYLSPYLEMVEYAKGRLQVFLGAEVTLTETGNDFLVYDVDRDFIRSLGYEFWEHISIDTLIRMAHARGSLIVAAHPFRDFQTTVPPCRFSKIEDGFLPDKFDAVEGYNCGNDDPFLNELAIEWAKINHIRTTSGADLHRARDNNRAGIGVKRRAKNAADLCEMIKRGEYCLLCDGEPLGDFGDLYPDLRKSR